jgi:hypothetical protein
MYRRVIFQVILCEESSTLREVFEDGEIRNTFGCGRMKSGTRLDVEG